jgi:hypothetical protein
MKSSDDISSMDLLLDTICNAFGGIVFIALLIAVLSRAAAPTQPLDSAVDRLKLVQLQAEKLALEREVRLLEAEYDRIISIKGTTETAENTDDARNQQRFNELMAELADLTDALQQSRTQLTKVSGQIAAADSEIATLKSEIARLEGIRPDTRDLESETRRLPRLRPAPSSLRQFFVVIRDGRFFPVTNLEYALSRRGGQYDPRFVHILSGPYDADFLDPIMSAGVPIDTGLGPQGSIRMLSEQLNPRQHLIAFFVSTNSFVEFNRVKTTFVQRGYYYSLDFEENAFVLTPGKVKSL